MFASPEVTGRQMVTVTDISQTPLSVQMDLSGREGIVRGREGIRVINIHAAYRILYNSGQLRDEAIADIRANVPMTKETEYILDFIQASKRGIIK